MTARAQDQLERLLLALPHLAEDTEIPLADLAKIVGCEADTLLADLMALTSLDRDIAGHVEPIELFLMAGSVGARTSFFRRPMRLSRSELAALDLGLGLLLLERPLEERATIRAVRTKLRQASVLPPARVSSGVVTRAEQAPPPPLEAEGVPAPHLQAFGRLCQAHEERRAVQLTYQRAGAESADVRLVHPWAIVRAHQHVYVVGWCASVTAVRVFRLDRIVHVELDGERFDVPPDFNVDTVLRDGRIFAGERPDDELVVHYSPHIARWIAERERLPLEPDGSVTVTWPLADDDWAVRHVLQYGADATVVSPARIREQVVATLERLGA
jgi:predicted DNA-binding transcriptional regulator YafY